MLGLSWVHSYHPSSYMLSFFAALPLFPFLHPRHAANHCSEPVWRGLNTLPAMWETKQSVRLSGTSWCELSWCDYSLMAVGHDLTCRCWQNNVRCVAEQCSGSVYAPVFNLGRLVSISWFISGTLWTLRQRLSMDRRNLLQWAWAMFDIHGLHVVYWIASDFMCFASQPKWGQIHLFDDRMSFSWGQHFFKKLWQKI